MMEKAIKWSLILLAGGKGLRMGVQTPKQFLKLSGKPIALHSFELFKSFTNLKEIIVVCDPSYFHYFQPTENLSCEIKFALPGKRRQDSAFNGLQLVSSESEYIAVHDSARPFLTKKSVEETLKEAKLHGAATLALPLKYTIKEKTEEGFIKKTLKREDLFEMQTPQIIRQDLLKEGFLHANEKHLEVTDDVSLVELLKKPVKLVIGSSDNIKITTKEDLTFAEFLMEKRNASR